ncbi:MAG: hypothetical protein OXH56_16880 [Gemmatimonadetes bacterium]|nr:hypothetical protein [Gemmatimonadota bacterium]
MTRATTVLTFLALSAFACGGTDNAPEDAAPETTEMAGGPYLTHDEFVNLLKEEIMSGKFDAGGIVGRSATVPPESGIENEGTVWLEVRTVNAVIDTAWVIASSGFPEVDEFALNQVLKRPQTPKIGWGDPPLMMHFTVKVPDDSDGQKESSTEFDTAELGTFSFLVTIPPDCDLKHEGDVRAVFHVVESLTDTAWVVESSGYPEVDEFAIEYMMKIRHPKDMVDDLLNAMVFVRHQP